MKSSTFFLTLSLFFLLAVGAYFRLIKLADLPAGLTWDEASMGYTGRTLATTGRDEWLDFLPISFRSFDDYKAPLAFYQAALSTSLFGVTPWAVRFPFALGGILTVLWMTLASRELLRLWFTNSLSPRAQLGWALGAGWLLALSPWHLLFSRVAFESGLALNLLLLGLWLSLRAWRERTQKKAWLLALLAALSLALTCYAYHSAKLFLPLALFFTTCYWWWSGWGRRQTRPWRPYLSWLGALALFLLPVLADALFGSGLARAQTSLFAQNLSFPTLIRQVGAQLALHLSPAFLIQGQTDTLRHSTGRWGVLLPSTAFFVALGVGLWLLDSTRHLIVLLKRWRSAPDKSLDQGWRSPSWGFASFSLLWLLIGLVPAAIGVEVPHPNRALLALPGFLWLALSALIWLQLSLWPRLKSHLQRSLLVFGFVSLSLLHLFFFARFWQDYSIRYPTLAAEAFTDGYLAMASRVWQRLATASPEEPVEQVVISAEYGQPYIYLLFTKPLSPFAYQAGALHHFRFPAQLSKQDITAPQTLLVFGPASSELESLRSQASEVIKDRFGKIVFYIVYTGEGEN